MSEGPSVYTILHPAARKEHSCYECGRKISKGSKYELFKGCWDGEFTDYKTCQPCSDLRQEINNESHDEPLAFGELAEAAQEYEYKFPPEPK